MRPSPHRPLSSPGGDELLLPFLGPSPVAYSASRWARPLGAPLCLLGGGRCLVCEPIKKASRAFTLTQLSPFTVVRYCEDCRVLKDTSPQRGLIFHQFQPVLAEGRRQVRQVRGHQAWDAALLPVNQTEGKPPHCPRDFTALPRGGLVPPSGRNKGQFDQSAVVG